jgi:CheY-like chemotaxis protein
VEDSTIVAWEICDRLTRKGYEVLPPVISGEQAVAAARRGTPDLVIMDIRLRGAMDGIEAVREIQKRTSIPVIYLTGNSDEATTRRVLETHPVAKLTKPFDEYDLLTAVAQAFNQKTGG